MITNLPSLESLNNVALKIFFRAWGDLLTMISDFSMMYGQERNIPETRTIYAEEWSEYIDNMQSDLQSVCSLLQQSMELALKARVCGVSPYLLLLNNGMKLTTSTKQIDFSVLKTIDATELPGAVNTLTDKPLTDEFIGRYSKLRSLRNKITHLGEAGVELDPDEMVRLTISLYLDLWSDRKWLPDRLNFASQTRQAWFYDGKYTSAHMEILHEWSVGLEIFTKGEFKNLFGHKKTERRYLCHHCIYQGDTRYAGLENIDCKTAYLDTDKKAVTCIMCSGTFQIDQKKCPSCKGNVIGAADDEFAGRCHTCGEDIE